jgi:hypothetical protein
MQYIVGQCFTHVQYIHRAIEYQDLTLAGMVRRVNALSSVWHFTLRDLIESHTYILFQVKELGEVDVRQITPAGTYVIISCEAVS